MNNFSLANDCPHFLGLAEGVSPEPGTGCFLVSDGVCGVRKKLRDVFWGGELVKEPTLKQPNQGEHPAWRVIEFRARRFDAMISLLEMLIIHAGIANRSGERNYRLCEELAKHEPEPGFYYGLVGYHVAIGSTIGFEGEKYQKEPTKEDEEKEMWFLELLEKVFCEHAKRDIVLTGD
jgi:hypothetical protein